MLEIILQFIIIYILGSILYWTLKTGISPMFSSFSSSKYIAHRCTGFDQQKIVDLGSGWGTLALYIAKKNPDKTVVGYELSPIPFYFSKLLVLISNQKNLIFYKKDFMDIKFQSDTLYICYLFPQGMEKIEKKLIDDTISPIIISSTFSFRSIQYKEKKVLNDLFLTPIYIFN